MVIGFIGMSSDWRRSHFISVIMELEQPFGQEFHRDKLTDPAFLQRKQNSTDYVNVFKNNLLSFANRKSGANYVFQQDITPIHTSKLTSTFIQKGNINVLRWLARSPEQSNWK